MIRTIRAVSSTTTTGPLQMSSLYGIRPPSSAARAASARAKPPCRRCFGAYAGTLREAARQQTAHLQAEVETLDASIRTRASTAGIDAAHLDADAATSALEAVGMVRLVQGSSSLGSHVFGHFHVCFCVSARSSVAFHRAREPALLVRSSRTNPGRTTGGARQPRAVAPKPNQSLLAS